MFGMETYVQCNQMDTTGTILMNILHSQVVEELKHHILDNQYVNCFNSN